MSLQQSMLMGGVVVPVIISMIAMLLGFDRIGWAFFGIAAVITLLIHAIDTIVTKVLADTEGQ